MKGGSKRREIHAAQPVQEDDWEKTRIVEGEETPDRQR